MVPLQSRLGTLSSITHSFPWLSSPRGYVTYVVLPRSPLSPLRVLARLACLIHAANVHSEPGSNPFEIVFTRQPHNPALPQNHAATECEHEGLSADARQGWPVETTALLRAPSPHKPPSRFGSRTPSTRFNTTKLISQNHPTKLSKNTAQANRRLARGGIVTASVVKSTQGASRFANSLKLFSSTDVAEN